MPEDRQLTIDGGEVPVEVPAPSREPQLTPAQRDVMLVIQRNGSIRPVEAGLILYAHTDPDNEHRERYASSDGSEMLRRLAIRGLVRREARGRWVEGREAVRLRRSEQRGPLMDVRITEGHDLQLGVIRFGEAFRNVGVSFGVAAMRITAMSDALRMGAAIEEEQLRRRAIGLGELAPLGKDEPSDP